MKRDGEGGGQDGRERCFITTRKENGYGACVYGFEPLAACACEAATCGARNGIVLRTHRRGPGHSSARFLFPFFPRVP